MKTSTRQQARQRLDERLAPFRHRDDVPPPMGWIRAIREALGMTGVQLAGRLGVRPQTVEALEKSEASGTIQLSTLRRAAAALDCTLVYALVPNRPLEETVRARARAIALRDLGRVAHSMRLEDQHTGDADLEAQIDAYIRDIVRDRDLWSDA